MEPILRALKATADPSRLRILRILTAGAFNVAELTEILGLGQSTVSRHLRILSDAGLVRARRAGTWAWYSLKPAGTPAFGDRLLDLLTTTMPSNGDGSSIQRVLARRRRATSDFFRQTAADWDSLREGALGEPVHVEPLAGMVGRAGTVVDLGTGTGILLERLAADAERVIGVDASPEMLELARRRVEEAGISNADLRLGTLEHLPLPDGGADVMVANMVLHHVADPPSVLFEIRRGLSPGGRLVIADLEELDDESFWRGIGALWPGFRPAEVRGWLADAGFDPVPAESRLPSGAPRIAGVPEVFFIQATSRS